jgi:hypothetical protein
MSLSNRWKTGSDFAIGLISSPRSEQDTARKRSPSNDRVAGNKTEKKTVLSTPWEQDSGALHSKRSKALPNQRSVPNGVWAEVEFGNARVYYQDYIKFLLAMRHRAAKLGILLCPTNAFAQLLCDLGQRRARVRSDDKSKQRPTYSGMMSYEKAMRELPFLEFMLTGSIVIAGIEIQGDGNWVAKSGLIHSVFDVDG